jgi:hypothetical protein
MKATLESNNLVIALFAPEILPSFLTEKFLKESTVIPKDWQFAQPPDIGDSDGLVVFTNGVQISAEEGAIFFSEELAPNRAERAILPKIVGRWVQIWSRLNHYGIAIKPNSFYTFKQDSKDRMPSHYIPTNLLTSQWRSLSQDSIRATLNLAMTCPKGEFSISIEDMLLQQQDGSLKAGVLFKGDFGYDLSDLSSSDRQQALSQYISSWQEDWHKFHQIISQKFLNLS